MKISQGELKRAVALFYDGESAPTVSASGSGLIAEQIIELADKNAVPLCDNAPLVELLSQLALGDEIPENLYLCVAHIIAFAHRMKIDMNEASRDQ